MFTHFLDDDVIEYNEKIIDIFLSYGCENISYGNDTCNSVGYYLNNKTYLHIFIPNSKINNPSNEQFNTFGIFLCCDNDTILEDDNQFYDFTEKIEDVLGFIESNKNIKFYIK